VTAADIEIACARGCGRTLAQDWTQRYATDECAKAGAIQRRARRGRREIDELGDRRWLATRRREGASLAEIADELDCTVEGLRQALLKFGMPTRQDRSVEQIAA
jgi:hypothetical protein